MQDEEYLARQYGEIDRNRSDAQKPELEALQGQQDPTSGSDINLPDLAGRQGTLGSGYFDAAGNWQTYDVDAAAQEPHDSRYGSVF